MKIINSLCINLPFESERLKRWNFQSTTIYTKLKSFYDLSVLPPSICYMYKLNKENE